DALAAGRHRGAVVTHAARPLDRVVFVCPGHGGQWPGMGRALLAESAAFAETVDACDAALRPHTGWSVRVALAGGEGLPPFDRPDVVQPALFAMALGLAAVWRALGLEPAAVVGHSVGEVAAAVIAGALSLDDGARVIAAQGLFTAKVACVGAMLSVGLPAAEVIARLAPWAGRLSLAVINSDRLCAVSGDPDAIAALARALSADEVFCRPTRIGYAGHGHHLDAIGDAFGDAIDGIAPRAATLPLYSATAGARIDGPEMNTDFWWRNLRDPVRFDRAVDALAADGGVAFIELCGHPALVAALTDHLGPRCFAVGAQQRQTAGLAGVHRALGALHTAGLPIAWSGLLGDGPVAALPAG
ncbi:MAG: acyltransferase domain-containing protein, partial [Myxococcales bacterium]|nr:acyltransferase domain-containing protein [Myxococcales bacterium]